MKSNIKDLVDRILSKGKITESEHKHLLAVISEDGKVDELELEQINRIIGKIEDGDLGVYQE
ncbi:MAG: hypothetical protein GY765_15305 [bacterium]|nr:hypothetical protein [bacterium]